MSTLVWPTVALWVFVAAMIVLTVRLLHARGQQLWVVVLGGFAAAVASYLIAMLVMIVVMSTIALLR